MAALKNTLETASHFNPLGRHHILTHYDMEDFFNVLENNLNIQFLRPNFPVIQSYSNNYVKKASGLSILFFKDLSEVSSARKKELFDRYSRSKFAKETGWDQLMMAYHRNILRGNNPKNKYYRTTH
jgi:hypothetical protein